MPRIGVMFESDIDISDTLSSGGLAPCARWPQVITYLDKFSFVEKSVQ